MTRGTTAAFTVDLQVVRGPQVAAADTAAGALSHQVGSARREIWKAG